MRRAPGSAMSGCVFTGIQVGMVGTPAVGVIAGVACVLGKHGQLPVARDHRLPHRDLALVSGHGVMRLRFVLAMVLSAACWTAFAGDPRLWLTLAAPAVVAAAVPRRLAARADLLPPSSGHVDDGVPGRRHVRRHLTPNPPGSLCAMNSPIMRAMRRLPRAAPAAARAPTRDRGRCVSGARASAGLRACQGKDRCHERTGRGVSVDIPRADRAGIRACGHRSGEGKNPAEPEFHQAVQEVCAIHSCRCSTATPNSAPRGCSSASPSPSACHVPVPWRTTAARSR
jgi:hypothetical protein